jgi:hypothetical protein
MGRPLNKKYFGNRNIGVNGGVTSDNGIGGEGIASIDNPVAGSININNSFPHFPGLTVAAPTLPNGVTALTTVTWEIDTVTFDGGGTTYTTGLTTAITGLTTQATVAPVINITHVTGGAPDAYNFTGGNRGEFTSIDATGITTWAVVKGAQTGAQATITFRVKSIAIANKGSGYIAVPSLTWTTLDGTTPSGNTPTLTTDSGAVGSVTNQENALLMTARLTGGSAVTVDIIKQVSTSRYKVTDGTRTGIVKLKSSVATAAGEGSLRLLDSDGGTYFATKLTAHKATITRGTGVQTAFPTGACVKWNMTAATADSLKIDNA